MYEYKADVTKVYDGDTITCNIDLGFGVVLKGQKIRLSGIDTPEIRGDERADGLISKEFVSNLILDKEIIIKTEKDSKGKYGRWLGEVFLPDMETSINKLLLETGHAKEYPL
jgi:micrococcal nuclease